MRNILLILSMLLCQLAFCQQNWTNCGNGYQTRVINGTREYRVAMNSPYEPFFVSDSLSARLAKRDSSAYVTPYGLRSALDTIGGGGMADSSVFATVYGTDTAKANLRAALGGKLGVADTAMMLAPYALASELSGKLNVSDTSLMLAPYRRPFVSVSYDNATGRQSFYRLDGTDTSLVVTGGGQGTLQTLSVSGQELSISGGNTVTLPAFDTVPVYRAISKKLDATDTLSLSHRIDERLSGNDTVSLSGRIDAKLGIADTTNMLAPYSTKAELALKLDATDTLSLSGRIDLKENSANKSADASLGTSDALYPTQKAVKGYVDAAMAAIESTYVPSSEKNAPNGVAGLDAIGKILVSQIPSVLINDVFTPSSLSEMLALKKGDGSPLATGDIAVRVDVDSSFALKAVPASDYANWVPLKVSRGAAIETVNGVPGPFVNLATGDIPESTNQYFTAARSRAAISASGSLTYDPVTGTVSYTAPTSLPPSGAASGDLSGAYPAPTVARFNGQLPGYYTNRANHTGEQPIASVTGLQSSLDGKEQAFSKNTAFNKNFGAVAGTVAEGNHSHANATATVPGFMSATDKSKLDGISAGADVSVNTDWNASSGKAQLLNKPSTFAPSAHTHNASDINAGTLATARLGSGTASSTTVLHGDNTWKAVMAQLNASAGTGISVTGTYPNLTWTNTAPNATHTGDVTGSTALVIANNVVTNAKLAQMPGNSIKGNTASSTASPSDISLPQNTVLGRLNGNITAIPISDISGGGGATISVNLGVESIYLEDDDGIGTVYAYASTSLSNRDINVPFAANNPDREITIVIANQFIGPLTVNTLYNIYVLGYKSSITVPGSTVKMVKIKSLIRGGDSAYQWYVIDLATYTGSDI